MKLHLIKVIKSFLYWFLLPVFDNNINFLIIFLLSPAHISFLDNPVRVGIDPTLHSLSECNDAEVYFL
jgi:uncharacterized protein YdhG (YjbR/CyaY superfamily)